MQVSSSSLWGTYLASCIGIQIDSAFAGSQCNVQRCVIAFFTADLREKASNLVSRSFVYESIIRSVHSPY